MGTYDFRHKIHTLSWTLEERYHQKPWSCAELEAVPEKIGEKIIERVNRGAGIFQEPGFLYDVLVAEEEQGGARY